MLEKQETEETKCIAVNLPVYLIRQLEDYKQKTGKSKNAMLVEFIKAGLNSA
jgi:predicted DNA-binding protein